MQGSIPSNNDLAINTPSTVNERIESKPSEYSIPPSPVGLSSSIADGINTAHIFIMGELVMESPRSKVAKKQRFPVSHRVSTSLHITGSRHTRKQPSSFTEQ